MLYTEGKLYPFFGVGKETWNRDKERERRIYASSDGCVNIARSRAFFCLFIFLEFYVSSRMGLLQKFIPKSTDKGVDKEIEDKCFSISDCASECDGCNFKFPSSVKIDNDNKLWNSINPYDLHILVTTGKTDWSHDAFLESNTFAYAFNKWISDREVGGLKNIKTNVCSLPLSNSDHGLEETGDILLLPHFIWVKNVSRNHLDTLTEVFENVFSAQSAADLKTQYDNSITVSIDPNRSWIFLCSHRTRDKRCGITAPIMKKEMEIYLRDLGLYRDLGDDRPGGIQIGFVNHIGGHKYAANVIIYLKNSGKNIWLARCNPSNVKPIVDECILNDGKIWPEKVRLIQKFQPHEW